MFTLTAEMLKMLITLSKEPIWNSFLKEFQKLRDENVEQVLHFIPDSADFNAKSRQDVLRGIAICLDVLGNSFRDPVSLLEEVQIIEKAALLRKETQVGETI